MQKKYFIADTHFGEERIRKYENRPFENATQMDQELVRKWNDKVRSEDIVYILGDFGADGYESEMLAKLNGKKILVKGNHDSKSNDAYRSFGFSEVYDCPIIIEGFWILSHDALYVNENMPYANLFGHVHNSPIVKNYSKQHYCVSVERIEYAPIDFEEIKTTISKLCDERL